MITETNGASDQITPSDLNDNYQIHNVHSRLTTPEYILDDWNQWLYRLFELSHPWLTMLYLIIKDLSIRVQEFLQCYIRSCYYHTNRGV